MTRIASCRLPVWQWLALAGLLLTVMLPAGAAGVAQGSQQRQLRLGIGYVAPAYRAGAKFRTPEAIENALADDLARRLQRGVRTVSAAPGSRAALLNTRRADLLLVALPVNDRLRTTAVTLPTGYLASPMAIMRTDTTIRSWQQLQGRTVCMTEGGRYAGMLAANYGAVEKLFKAPADALLALRIGGCDAAVHDSALLEELLKLPEWKKFSARLTAGAPALALEFVVPANDPATLAWLQSTVKEWQVSTYLQQQLALMARNIAFEVYLDQNVPDCH